MLMVTFHSRLPGTDPTPERLPLQNMSFKAGRVDINWLRTRWDRGPVQLLVFHPGTTEAERIKVAIYAWLRFRGNAGIITFLAWAALLFTLNPMPMDFFAKGLIVALGGIAIAGIVLLLSWWAAAPTLATAQGILCQARIFERRLDNGRFAWVPDISAGDKELLELYARRLQVLDDSNYNEADFNALWEQIYQDLAAVTAMDVAPRGAAS